jgi:hypothetical protein
MRVLSLRRRRGRLHADMALTPTCPDCGALVKPGQVNLHGIAVLPSGGTVYAVSCKYCTKVLGTVVDEPNR